jgi:hypothetical protein
MSSMVPSAAAPSAGADTTAVPTSLDPCQLVTAQEAAAITGATYPAGKEGTTSGGAKTCTYGGSTLDIFTVIVAQAPDAASAQAAEAEAEATMQEAAGTAIKTTPVPNLGDNAAYASFTVTAGGQSFSGSGIYVLKGTIFFAFSGSKLGTEPPTLAAMQAQAQMTLTRIP